MSSPEQSSPKKRSTDEAAIIPKRVARFDSAPFIERASNQFLDGWQEEIEEERARQLKLLEDIAALTEDVEESAARNRAKVAAYRRGDVGDFEALTEWSMRHSEKIIRRVRARVTRSDPSQWQVQWGPPRRLCCTLGVMCPAEIAHGCAALIEDRIAHKITPRYKVRASVIVDDGDAPKPGMRTLNVVLIMFNPDAVPD